MIQGSGRVTPLEWLQATGLTYKELAEVCDCSYDGVRQWFKRGSGHRNPHPTVYRLLAVDLELRRRNATHR